MRRSSCPSVKRAKLQLDITSSPSGSSGNDHAQAKIEVEKCRENTSQSAPNEIEKSDPKPESSPRMKDDALPRKAPLSIDDHLMTVRELEARNADKMLELKQTLRSAQRTDHLALLRRGIDDNDSHISSIRTAPESESSERAEVEDEEEKKERLLEELRCWEEAEQELDGDLATRGKSRGESHIDKLHEYNDLKDACQAVFGRLAELDEVTVSDIYKRYSVDVND